MPLITTWFVFLGAGAILGEIVHMDISNQPLLIRVLVNLAYILGFFEVARRATIAMFAI
jgi:hypothetical protein